MRNWGNLKTSIRNILWPHGEGFNLVSAHDKAFLDAIMDIQKWVTCAQQDNFNTVPQCATFYRCGLTILDSPRGYIKSVSVIDKINPDTGQEDPAAADDFCSEIFYTEIDYCHVERYQMLSKNMGCCMPIPIFFGLMGCNKASYPVPTDEGLPPGLPTLPLGYHYPQTSTDRTYGRSPVGVWAKDRGKIYIAPWIQSTESIIIKWDGLKREWNDADLIEDDPDLDTAILEFVRKEHADKWDKDEAEFVRSGAAYQLALQKLIRECREETRARECEGSNARWSTPTATNLYYNEDQTATADCPQGQSGSSVTVKIPAGTVASSISVADANQKAQQQAQQQAQAQLVCSEVTTYSNTAVTVTVGCSGDPSAPPPSGNPVTVTIPAGTVTSDISVADANQKATALAQSQASSQLSCTFWNRAQTYTAVCGIDPNIKVQKTVAEKTFSSTLSQADADQQALTEATNQANTALQPICVASSVFWNTPQICSYTNFCKSGCKITVTVDVKARCFNSVTSQEQANALAKSQGNQYAFVQFQSLCGSGNPPCNQLVHVEGPWQPQP